MQDSWPSFDAGNGGTLWYAAKGAVRYGADMEQWQKRDGWDIFAGDRHLLRGSDGEVRSDDPGAAMTEWAAGNGGQIAALGHHDLARRGRGITASVAAHPGAGRDSRVAGGPVASWDVVEGHLRLYCDVCGHKDDTDRCRGRGAEQRDATWRPVCGARSRGDYHEYLHAARNNGKRYNINSLGLLIVWAREVDACASDLT